MIKQFREAVVILNPNFLLQDLDSLNLIFALYTEITFCNNVV